MHGVSRYDIGQRSYRERLVGADAATQPSAIWKVPEQTHSRRTDHREFVDMTAPRTVVGSGMRSSSLFVETG